MLYKNFSGIVKKIKYEDIKKIKEYNNKAKVPIKYKIYIGHRTILVENFVINFNEFTKVMKRKLKKCKSKAVFLQV